MPAGRSLAPSVEGVLCDLLMGVMNSLETWSAAAGDRRRGLAWRDAVTTRMTGSASYVPYERLVSEAAAAHGLPAEAPAKLFAEWATMEPWPDAAALDRLTVPYAFVTNCSAELAAVAASRSGLTPAFILSAQEAARYKPDPRVYLEACRRLGTDHLPRRVGVRRAGRIRGRPAGVVREAACRPRTERPGDPVGELPPGGRGRDRARWPHPQLRW